MRLNIARAESDVNEASPKSAKVQGPTSKVQSLSGDSFAFRVSSSQIRRSELGSIDLIGRRLPVPHLPISLSPISAQNSKLETRNAARQTLDSGLCSLTMSRNDR